jgi:hypothetical protein
MSFATSRSFNPSRLLSRVRPATIFAMIILTALLAFELFNYSTTEYALRDILGKMTFLGMSWATILSIAFCGIDFAGIARLFTPERGADEPKEIWYLFGAWLLAATMNAILTWWGVSMAIANHTLQSESILDNNTITTVVPVFVALMVWVIRILIIGTISVAGERFIWGEARRSSRPSQNQNAPAFTPRPNLAPRVTVPRPGVSAMPVEPVIASGRSEPTYHSMINARPMPHPGGLDNNSRKL